MKKYSRVTHSMSKLGNLAIWIKFPLCLIGIENIKRGEDVHSCQKNRLKNKVRDVI
jgi:hypothetical protein